MPWFHFAQAVVKRTKKVGLTDAYANEESTQVVSQGSTQLKVPYF